MAEYEATYIEIVEMHRKGNIWIDSFGEENIYFTLIWDLDGNNVSDEGKKGYCKCL